jgi:hypothetical protein
MSLVFDRVPRRSATWISLLRDSALRPPAPTIARMQVADQHGEAVSDFLGATRKALAVLRVIHNMRSQVIQIGRWGSHSLKREN